MKAILDDLFTASGRANRSPVCIMKGEELLYITFILDKFKTIQIPRVGQIHILFYIILVPSLQLFFSPSFPPSLSRSRFSEEVSSTGCGRS